MEIGSIGAQCAIALDGLLLHRDGVSKVKIYKDIAQGEIYGCKP